MQFTCLSKGSGLHFPSCHILNVSGLTVLIDCPMDISALKIFSPIPDGLVPKHLRCDRLGSDLESPKRKKIKVSSEVKGLIFEEPWYKIAKNLNLWDPCCIHVVLISSMMGVLGLPFLTRVKGFSAKIYMTEATARLGKLMMDDLVSMHAEFRQFYGPEESGSPQWMKWENLELLPPVFREVALGQDGTELGGWMPLYSAVDVKDCMQRVQTLRYAEEACYDGILVIKAFSSGSDIGSCNWNIKSPKGNTAYVSNSVVAPAHAMEFDYHVLEGIDQAFFSDFLCQDIMEDAEQNCDHPMSTTDDLLTSRDNEVGLKDLTAHLLSNGEMQEEKEKLAFICSCLMDSVNAGGSVLVPLCRVGNILQLLEQIADSLKSSAMNVPIFFVSSIAEELLSIVNVLPEWLCKQRQEKMFAGDPLFSYTELLTEQRLHVFPALYSCELLTKWQEPCVVFCPHWSLRLGPVVNLLRLWGGNQNSLLVLEDGVDDVAFLPFKQVKMKILKCSFLSGIRLPTAQMLLRLFGPKVILFPDDLRQQNFLEHRSPSSSVMYYTETEMLSLSSLKDDFDLEIATDMATNLTWMKVKENTMDITRLKGQLLVANGKYQLLSGDHMADSNSTPFMLWGSPDACKLLTVLSKMGINGSLEAGFTDHEQETVNIIRLHEPDRALIEIRGTGTIINSPNADLAAHIFEALSGLLDGI